MSNKKTVQTMIRAILTTPQRVVRYIFSAATQIFSPTDDNYPATGEQPFKGDPADKKSH